MSLNPNDLLKQLRPIAHLLGLDKRANALGRAQVEPLFLAAVPRVVARLEADGHTFATEGDGPESERFLIRSAMYLLAKDALSTKLPRGANLAADYLRDKQASKIVALVAPQVDRNTTMTALVELVCREWLNLIF